jgi:hypothetical protein
MKDEEIGIERIKRSLEGEEVEGVGVMKDEEIKLEEIEASHTLGQWNGGNHQGRFCLYSAVILCCHTLLSVILCCHTLLSVILCCHKYLNTSSTH